MALHPTAVATEGHTRKLKRSSSFGDALKRILPSNRRERGYTLREQYRMSEDSSRDSQDHVKSIFGGENVANGPAATLSGMNVPNGTATLTSDTKGEETKRPGAIRRMLRSLGSLKKKKIENLDAKSIINNSGDEQRVPIIWEPLDVQLPLVELPRVTREEKHKSTFGGMNVAKGPAATLSGMNVPNRLATLTSESKSKPKPAVEKKLAEVKKTPAKEERRRFRRSEDFLGVQGANPKTGTWDSDPTITTEQMSEETQKRVDNQAKKLTEAKIRYEEEQRMHRDVLQIVQTLKAAKKREKEQEKLAEKMRRRRGSKWRLTETGWSNAELSPIAPSPVLPPMENQLNVGSSDSQHTIIHRSPSFFRAAPEPSIVHQHIHYHHHHYWLRSAAEGAAPKRRRRHRRSFA